MGIEVKKKACKGCGALKYIWARGHCKWCDQLAKMENAKKLAEEDGDGTLTSGNPSYEELNKQHRKKKRTKIRPYSEKMQKIKNDEGKAMREFWELTEDYRGWNQCSESGLWLRGYAAIYVHHIWTKGAGSAARCDKDNFIILSAEAHDQAHNFEGEMKVGAFMKERRQQMKTKYAKLAMGDHGARGFDGINKAS
jgi:hypothetical protein